MKNTLNTKKKKPNLIKFRKMILKDVNKAHELELFISTQR